MTPRSGKRRRRGKFPVPFLLPLPRPCLRSLNLPGRNYMPVAPEIYLPWAYPPPYFMIPPCPCAREDFCTPSTCKNSGECLKLLPEFCPYGNRDEGLDTQQDPNREVEEMYTNAGTSLDPKTGVCSACGGMWTVDGNNERQEDATRSFNSDVRQQDDSYDPRNQSGTDLIEDVNSQKNTFIIEGKAAVPQERVINAAHRATRFLNENATPESSPSERPLDTRSESSSQTAHRVPSSSRASTVQNSKYSSPKRAGRLIGQLPMRYGEDSESFPNNSVPLSSITKRVNHLNKNAGCCNRFVRSNVPDSGNRAMVRTPNNQNEVSDRKPAQNPAYNRSPNKTYPQIDRDTSIARKKQKSSCSCSTSATGSLTKCKMQVPGEREIRKTSSKSRKLSECSCSTKKLQVPDEREFKNSSSKSLKLSGCRCSAKLAAKKSFMGLNNDISSHPSLTAPKCQCKYPPAYSHLSCKADPAQGCHCANMPLQ